MIRSVLSSKPTIGRVRVRNSEGFESYGENAVVFSGADILTQLLAGNIAYKISMFYAEYVNTSGSVSEPAVARTDTAATRQAMASPHDALRFPLAAAPAITASGGNYQGNLGAYFGISSATTGFLNALPFTAGADSKVYSVCLVATPVPGTPSMDVLYSRYLLGTPVPVTGTGQISVGWSLEAQ